MSLELMCGLARDNKPADPGFLLPETFMEVGTDQQFEFLRDWQRTVYEAGYLGMAWPRSTGRRSSPGLSGYCESGNGEARVLRLCQTPLV